MLLKAFLAIYDRTTSRTFAVRRIGISFTNVVETEDVQLSLFTNQEELDKERKLELAICSIKNKIGKKKTKQPPLGCRCLIHTHKQLPSSVTVEESFFFTSPASATSER